jgi:transcriptional regulator with XRE-family HTH domain
MTFGKRLRQLRENKQLSQLDLSKLLNIANSTLSLYEADKRFPEPEILKRIADFFGVSIDYLLGHNPDTPTPADKEPTLDDEIMAIMRDLGPDITLQFYDLKGMTDEEKENLKIFLQGLKARRKEREEKKN